MSIRKARPLVGRRAGVSRSSIAERLFAETHPPGPPPPGNGPSCLPVETLERLARGDRAMDGFDRIDAHLATCDHCCDALASAVDAANRESSQAQRELAIAVPLASLMDRSRFEPVRLAASSAPEDGPRWLSHEEGDVRVIVRARGSDLLAVVERAGHPVPKALVHLEGGDGVGTRTLLEGKRTNARGEVSLGSRDQIAAMGSDIRLQVRLASADPRPPDDRVGRRARPRRKA